MNSEYILAIDAGTGSCRAVLFDIEGNQKAIEQKEWSHDELSKYPGSQVFDTKENWESIRHCIQKVIRNNEIDPAAIRAVSSTSMREGMVLYNEKDEEIWACPNVDGRAREEARFLIENNFAEEIYKESGDWISITSPSRFLWLKNNEPEIYKKTKKMTMISDWILFKLSGEFATDCSVGSSSGLFNIRERVWSSNIANLLELAKTILPEVYESGTVIGTVHSQAAEDTGLLAGTPVVLGGADTQMGLTGIKRIHPGDLTIVGGSFWQTTVVSDTPLIDKEKRLRTLCHSVPNKWMVEGIGFYCGLTMRWFRDAFCDLEIERAEERKVDPYVLMEELAAKVPPGSNGVTGIFSNIMDAKRWIHASPSFLQFDIDNPSHSGKKECIRAIQESAAYISNGHLKIIEELTEKNLRNIVFTGGGAKGQLWSQIIADVLGANVSVPKVKESSSLGTAIYAGIGAGIYTSVDSAFEEKKAIEKVYFPNPENYQLYCELFDRWLKIYARSLELVEQKLTRPLWRANGL
ncbi:autoinducer-2 kinase [Pseudogracilibacillus sp. SO30301A]|uniref:autoinducer-2 kinase n=1 Tax=Pseudogracilibacillus sp. SO30301A TaxID=3098291 RepID=UPI00300DD7A5